MELSNIISIAALFLAIVSLGINYWLSKKISKQQAQFASLENNRLRLPEVRKELTDLGFEYDKYLQQANSLISTEPEKAQEAFMKSAQVINKITQLYERTRTFLSKARQQEIDFALAKTRNEENQSEDDRFNALISFVQEFDKAVDSEL